MINKIVNRKDLENIAESIKSIKSDEMTSEYTNRIQDAVSAGLKDAFIIDTIKQIDEEAYNEAIHQINERDSVYSDKIHNTILEYLEDGIEYEKEDS